MKLTIELPEVDVDEAIRALYGVRRWCRLYSDEGLREPEMGDERLLEQDAWNVLEVLRKALERGRGR